MKNLATALSLLLVFVSCQKEYLPQNLIENQGAGNTSGSFKARINSAEWTARQYAVAFSTAGNGLPRLINISGISKDKKVISITLADSGVHHYTFGDNDFNGALYLDSTLPNITFTTVLVDNENAGTADITAINTAEKTISGTFSFKALRETNTASINITEGTFTNIPYVDGAILPPSAATDTFHVKINDSLFTPNSISGNAIPFNHTLMIQGSNSTAVKTVAITVPDNITAGSYSMEGFTYFGLYNDSTNSLGSVSGTLKILEHNTAAKRIRGNFNFKAENVLDPNIAARISEGYFSVKYK